MTRAEFIDIYVKSILTMVADGSDAFPQPAQVLHHGDPTLTVAALALNADGVLSWAAGQSADPTVRLLAFGLDRYGKSQQGTTQASVFTYIVASRGEAPIYGFVEYGTPGEEPRHHVLEPGEFWHDRMAATLPQFIKPLIAA